jgi:hypothetical protein
VEEGRIATSSKALQEKFGSMSPARIALEVGTQSGWISRELQPGSDGKLPPVGNTVDVENANWTNTIGAAELGAVWTDPDFEPDQKAFYYARVIEIPTPRWTTYDAFRFGLDLPEGVPTSTQERAYTSPIWYTP